MKMQINLPCDFGDRVYHVIINDLKTGEKQYVIIEAVVDSIHIGGNIREKVYVNKKHKPYNAYVKLRSVNTGYVYKGLSFDEFKEFVFYSVTEAEKKIRELRGY
jgi:DNA helicase IV